MLFVIGSAIQKRARWYKLWADHFRRLLDYKITRRESALTGITSLCITTYLFIGNTARDTIVDGSGRGTEGQGIKAYVCCKDLRVINNICIKDATDGIALLPGVSGAVISNKCAPQPKRRDKNTGRN